MVFLIIVTQKKNQDVLTILIILKKYIKALKPDSNSSLASAPPTLAFHKMFICSLLKNCSCHMAHFQSLKTLPIPQEKKKQFTNQLLLNTVSASVPELLYLKNGKRLCDYNKNIHRQILVYIKTILSIIKCTIPHSHSKINWILFDFSEFWSLVL